MRMPLTVLDETARYLARGIGAIAAIANPQKVILGGSIGLRPELIERVTRFLPQCFPYPVEIEASVLGARAAIVGAAAIGLSHLHNALFGADAPDSRMSLPPARRRPSGRPAMTTANALTERLRAALDREMRSPCCAARSGARASPATRRISSAISKTQMRRAGSTISRRADFLPGRPNIWGERKGAGGGKRLLFIGHTDTVHVVAGASTGRAPSARIRSARAIVDGQIWGRGAGDLKAGICSLARGARRCSTRRASGWPATSPLPSSATRRAASRAPAVAPASRISRPHRGAARSPSPDFAIYVEPTRLDVYPAQMGFFIADIEVTGRSAYFGVPELGVDALKASHAVLRRCGRIPTRSRRAPSIRLIGRGVPAGHRA